MVKTQQVDLVRQSYGRCIGKGDFFAKFYDKFLGADPKIKEKFANTDFEQQYHLLRHGINLLIMFSSENIAGKKGIDRIRESHRVDKINIEPHLYPIWKKALLDTVSTHDRMFNQEVASAWDQVLQYGIDHIKAGYQK